MMRTVVYRDHGINIRQLGVWEDERGLCYEIYVQGAVQSAQQRLTDAEFRKMILELVKHLMEAEK